MGLTDTDTFELGLQPGPGPAARAPGRSPGGALASESQLDLVETLWTPWPPQRVSRTDLTWQKVDQQLHYLVMYSTVVQKLYMTLYRL